MAHVMPTEKRQYRACLLCSLIKVRSLLHANFAHYYARAQRTPNWFQNATQFRAQGCDNCEDIMRMRGSMERVQECTSSNFDG
ncbi:hypothetical protein BC936DRAFT_137944 [Jimgerdemannia flammicorona]|nr:hypothetical protein BC936DRAFT_137944 [Jimgerdemannia flammicorona]